MEKERFFQHQIVPGSPKNLPWQLALKLLMSWMKLMIMVGYLLNLLVVLLMKKIMIMNLEEMKRVMMKTEWKLHLERKELQKNYSEYYQMMTPERILPELDAFLHHHLGA